MDWFSKAVDFQQGGTNPSSLLPEGTFLQVGAAITCRIHEGTDAYNLALALSCMSMYLFGSNQVLLMPEVSPDMCWHVPVCAKG